MSTLQFRIKCLFNVRVKNPGSIIYQFQAMTSTGDQCVLAIRLLSEVAQYVCSWNWLGLYRESRVSDRWKASCSETRRWDKTSAETKLCSVYIIDHITR